MGKSVVRVNHPVVQKKIEKTLKLSMHDGASTSIASSFSLSYFSPFALLMNATAAQMGILYALINLVPSLAQLKAANLIDRFSRKKIVLTAVMMKILLVIPILASGLLFYLGVPHMAWVFIGLVSLDYMFASIARPAWFSWMGSLVPEEKRGNYFSERNRIIGFFGVVAMIIGGVVLDWAKNIGFQYGDVLAFTLIGFGTLFVLSGFFRLWAWILLARQYEPRIIIRKKDHFSLVDFLKRAKETPFGRFSIFAGIYAFVVGISTPFWVVYMLRDLNFSYIWYMAATVSGVIFQIIFLPLLGKFSDRFGNIKLIKLCSFLVASVPFLWVATVLIESDLAIKFYLLIVPCLASGFGWAGYNLAVNNYVYDAVSGPKRGFGLSYMNLLIGVGGFVGAGLGSLIAWIGVSFMNPILFIFTVSGVGRLLVFLYGSKFLREVRNVKKFAPQFLVREFAPVQGVVREVHSLEHLVEKVEHYVVPKEIKYFEKNS